MKIIETNNVIKLKILEEISRQIDTRFQKRRPALLSEVRSLARDFLVSSSTFDSLVNGSLNKQFGFVVGTSNSKVLSIVELAVSKINIVYNKPTKGKGSFGKIYINLYRGSESLINNDASIIEDDDYKIPWLKWLLTAGDEFIIDGYDVFLQEGLGRSGGAIMVTNNASAWRVPPEFAGTESDNWFTRTLSSTTFQASMEQTFKRILGGT